MNLFFLFIFVVYGGVHVYAFLKARTALGFDIGAGTALALFMLLMTLAPFFVRALEMLGYELGARVLSYVAYLWMAVLFLYFSSSVLVDGTQVLARSLAWITRLDLRVFIVAPKSAFMLSLGLSLIISVYGYLEALNIRTERIRVETPKLPAGVEQLTIAQITDVHLGLIIRKERLEQMLSIINEAKPDILVSTGDLVDAQINHLTGLAGILRDVKPRLGKYAITGNHEYYAGVEKAVAFEKDAGFTVLRNEVAEAGPITLVGLNDRTGVQMKLERPIVEKDLYAKVRQGSFTLLLKHQPLVDRNSIGLFDLQISGHTHRGQIFPFTLITRLFFPLNAGNFDLGKGSRLHVSRGTGTWGPPIRFLAPPEITIYELVRVPL